MLLWGLGVFVIFKSDFSGDTHAVVELHNIFDHLSLWRHGVRTTWPWRIDMFCEDDLVATTAVLNFIGKKKFSSFGVLGTVT